MQSVQENTEGERKVVILTILQWVYNMLSSPHEFILGYRLRLPTTMVVHKGQRSVSAIVACEVLLFIANLPEVLHTAESWPLQGSAKPFWNRSLNPHEYCNNVLMG
jgi:hypothetical protein